MSRGHVFLACCIIAAPSVPFFAFGLGVERGRRLERASLAMIQITDPEHWIALRQDGSWLVGHVAQKPCPEGRVCLALTGEPLPRVLPPCGDEE